MVPAKGVAHRSRPEPPHRTFRLSAIIGKVSKVMDAATDGEADQATHCSVGRRAVRPVRPPDFDEGQRLDYLPLSAQELALASSRPGLHAQVYCALQVGYFKAKHAFFRFAWAEVEEDCAFVLTRYFNDQVPERRFLFNHHLRSQELPPQSLHCLIRDNAISRAAGAMGGDAC